MSDEIKINRPMPQASQPVMQNEAAAGKPSRAPWIILAAVVVLLVVAGVVFRGQLFGKQGSADKSGAENKSSAYQAVFLTNGQVYFGKLSNAGGDYVTLTDIYYLQVGPQQGSQQPSQPNQQSQQQITLVKLGQELHGPVDEMRISRQQILFYENLKEDGQVVKAIMQDKSPKK